ncbi:MAG: alpha/beta hydrolase [Acidocella sp. 20-61-6]|nr:MAG: alpha/beta hydrolase [Acidocella sp. 20-61-6]
MIFFIAAAFIAGLLVVGFWLYTPDLSPTLLAVRYGVAETDFVEVAGVRLRIKDQGPQLETAILLLHGFGASLETWLPWAAEISQRFRVVSVDLPGFGLTGPDPSGDYSDQRTVELMVALLVKLRLSRVSIIGNSLGGKIAWQLAASHPGLVASLVLVSPDGFASPGFEYGKPSKLPWIMKLLPYTLPRAMLRMNLAVAYAQPKRLTHDTLRRYEDMMLAPGNRRAMLARMEQVMLVPPEPQLRRISAPTLILWGEQDKMIPYRNASDYLSAIAGSTLVASPGLGHVPFEEDPAASLPPVLEFLTTHHRLASALSIAPTSGL